MSKSTFIMRDEWWDMLEDMTDEQRGVFLAAIYQFRATGELPEISDSHVRGVAKYISRSIAETDDKYEKKCQKLSKNASKRWDKEETDTDKDAIASNENANACKEMQLHKFASEKNAIAYDTDSESDSDSESDIDIDIPTGCSSSGSDDTAAQEPISTQIKQVAEHWNRMTEGTSIAKVSKISRSSNRYKSLSARIREYGYDEVVQAIDRIARSDFLCGRSKEWVITFDWFLKPNNFIKVHDGNYDNKASPPKPLKIPSMAYQDSPEKQAELSDKLKEIEKMYMDRVKEE